MSWQDDEVVTAAPTHRWQDDEIIAPKKPPTKSILSKTLDADSTGLLKGAYGLAEAGSNMVTGLGSSALGGLAGLSTLATGGGFDKATERIEGIQEGLTTQPKTEEGKTAAHIAAYPVEINTRAMGEMGRRFDEMLGNEGPALENIGKVIPGAVATVLGGRPVLRAAGEAGVLKAAKEQAARVQGSVNRDATITASNIANRTGVAVDPLDVNPSRHNRTVESVVSPIDRQAAIAKANEFKPETALKLDVGLDRGVELNPATLRQARDTAGGYRTEIQAVPSIIDDGTTVAQIRNVRPNETLGDSAVQGEISGLIADANRMVREGMSGADALRQVEQLRSQVRNEYNSSHITPVSRSRIEAKQGIADAIEAMIERNVGENLAASYRRGRQTQAKTYALEDILDPHTGKINIKKLAELGRGDSNLTGAFADYSTMAGRFPESFIPPEHQGIVQKIWSQRKLPAIVGGAIGTTIAPGLGTAGGAALGIAAGELASRFGANRLAKSAYQNKHAVAPDFRTPPPYVEPPTPPQLGFAPDDGSPLSPQSPQSQGQMPQGRGLLSLADDPLPGGQRGWEPDQSGIDFPLQARNTPLYNRGGIPKETGLQLADSQLTMPSIPYQVGDVPQGRGLLSLADEPYQIPPNPAWNPEQPGAVEFPNQGRNTRLYGQGRVLPEQLPADRQLRMPSLRYESGLPPMTLQQMIEYALRQRGQ